ncbi:MAG TPA: hypothetical protein VK524_04695 [Polyangiaceae bacterium]|nr:hypothetical protein [Polyangiaceae bacterium]
MRRHWEYWLGAVIALLALCCAVPEHRFAAGVDNAIGFDDGYTIALGERLIDGHWLPYVDGLSHRGPLLYWATAASLVLTERLSWVGPRWLVIGAFFLAAAGCFAAGAAARRPVAGAIGTAFYVFAICGAFPAQGALALTGEKISAPFCAASLTLTSLALQRIRSPRARVVNLALAGLCAALAGLAKQTALLLFLPAAIWALAAALSRSEVTSRQRWLEACALPAGWAATLGMALLPYAWSGNLHAFYYWFVEYNAKIYMEPYRGVVIRDEIAKWWGADAWTCFAAILLTLVPLSRSLGALVGSPRDAARRLTSIGFEFATASSALLGLLSAIVAFRIWPHYFIAILTYFALLIGIYVDDALRAPKQLQRLTAVLVTALLLLVMIRAVTLNRYRFMVKERKEGGWSAAAPEPICNFVERHSRRDQKIFIWGFDADLYLTCKRGPATSFAYLSLVAGIVPPFWDQRRSERVVPGAPARLESELRHALPPIILDAPQRLGGISMRAVPEANAVLKELYCPGPVLSGGGGRQVTAYLLRDRAGCAQPSAQH